MELRTHDIESLPVCTQTGSRFGWRILAIVCLKDGSRYDLLFDKDGELVSEQDDTTRELAAFFGKEFMPATLDGQKCLVNIVKTLELNTPYTR